MSIFSFERPAYAETHFKFKLPWSLLYRPWPEIFFDAPVQFVPGVRPKIWLVIRDADRFPVDLESVNIFIKRFSKNVPNISNIQNLKFNFNSCIAAQNPDFLFKNQNIFQTPETESARCISLSIHEARALAFHELDLGELPPGNYAVFTKLRVRQGSKTKTILCGNYPGLKTLPLTFQVLSENLPKPEGFAAGEMHCHTHYSADHVEFGAPPKILQQAAKAVGLDFVCCTDHAYDFAFSASDYTQEAEPISRFQTLCREIETLETYPLMLPGEEISVGNKNNENVHLLAFAPNNYIPGLGDCGRYWLKNQPTLKIREALLKANVPCFAAHPKAEMGALERFVFRRGYWHADDLATDSQNPIAGIQFFNGTRDAGFLEGKNFWIQELQKENYLFPIGGNDAHGDLNHSVSVSLPLFKLRQNKNHVFGNVRTVIQTAAVTQSELTKAFSSFKNKTPNSLYITNGPALWFERHADFVSFFAKTNREIGFLKHIKIFGRKRLLNGRLDNKETLLPESLILPPAECEIRLHFSDYAYLRAETETEFGTIALTAACPNL